MDVFYKNIIENSPIAYASQRVIYNEEKEAVDYEFIQVNKAFEKLTGLSAETLKGKKISQIFSVEKDFDFFAFYANLSKENETIEIEHFFMPLSKWYKITGTIPKKGFLITSFTDITEKKEEDKALKNLIKISEEFLSSYDAQLDFQKITDIFLELCKAKFVAINIYENDGKHFRTLSISGDSNIISQAYNILGFQLKDKLWSPDPKRDETIRKQDITRFKSLKELTGNTIARRIIFTIEKVFNLGETIIIKITKDGQIIGDLTLAMKKNVTFKENLIIDLYRRQLGLIISHKKEVEYRKEKERITKESEAKHKTYTENAPIGIFVTNEKGQYIDVNEFACKMTGYSKEELLELSLSDFLIPEDIERGFENFKLLSITGNSEGEFRSKKKNGNIYWFKLTATKISNTKYIAFCENITAKKENEQNLITAKKQAEEASSAKSRFLSNTSHEIRTPLSGISGFLHLLKTTNLTNEQQEYVNNIEISSQMLLGLINNILDLSKIEAGKMELERLEFNFHDEINKTIMFFTPRLKEKNIHLKNDTSQSTNKTLIGDPTKIKQIINNLLNNAIKFTPENGTIKLTISSQNITDELIKFNVCVIDTGIGISKENLQKLFKPFSQADFTTTRKFGGTGLGLAISKKLIEMMDGKISVDSEEGKGTTFSFYIILESAKINKTKSLEEKGPKIIKENKKKGKLLSILLVEDNNLNAKLFSKLLEKNGYNCDIAINGKNCLEKISVKHYDVIFMDCQMPIMNGYEATQKIKESGNNVHIVALTADAMKEDMERCYNVGMNEFLSKPIDIDNLLKILENLAV